MPDITERRAEALATAESYESRGRYYKAAEFLLRVAFLSDDDDAYDAYIKRGQILESIGWNPLGAYRAAQECALASNPPSYDRAMETYYLLANSYSQRGRHDVSGMVLRDAAEVLFVFENEFEWDDTAAIEKAQGTIDILSEEYARLFATRSSTEVQMLPASRKALPKATATPGEALVDALPVPGFGLSA